MGRSSYHVVTVPKPSHTNLFGNDMLVYSCISQFAAVLNLLLKWRSREGKLGKVFILDNFNVVPEALHNQGGVDWALRAIHTSATSSPPLTGPLN